MPRVRASRQDAGHFASNVSQRFSNSTSSSPRAPRLRVKNSGAVSRRTSPGHDGACPSSSEGENLKLRSISPRAPRLRVKPFRRCSSTPVPWSRRSVPLHGGAHSSLHAIDRRLSSPSRFPSSTVPRAQRPDECRLECAGKFRSGIDFPTWRNRCPHRMASDSSPAGPLHS